MHTLTAPLTTDQGYDQYFENIAESNKLIMHEPNSAADCHYYHGIDDLKGLQVKGVNMIVTRLPIQYEGENIDALHEVLRFQVTILKAAGERTEVQIQEALQSCRVIMKQILSKLQYDSDAMRGTSVMFSYFKIQQSTIDILDEPQYSDGQVGVSATVGIGNQTRFTYSANDWR